tara:strand:+ start:215 stop:433 length:219 start_codon:yes stop_codon:yes gene_type:complete
VKYLWAKSCTPAASAVDVLSSSAVVFAYWPDISATSVHLQIESIVDAKLDSIPNAIQNQEVYHMFSAYPTIV